MERECRLIFYLTIETHVDGARKLESTRTKPDDGIRPGGGMQLAAIHSYDLVCLLVRVSCGQWIYGYKLCQGSCMKM